MPKMRRNRPPVCVGVSAERHRGWARPVVAVTLHRSRSLQGIAEAQGWAAVDGIQDAGKDGLCGVAAPETYAMWLDQKPYAGVRMIEPAPIEVICPVCGRSMILFRAIRRTIGEDLNVFQCKPCEFSITEPVSWTTRPVLGGA